MLKSIINQLTDEFSNKINYDKELIKRSIYTSKDPRECDFTFQSAKLTTDSDKIQDIYNKLKPLENQNNIKSLINSGNIIKIILKKENFVNEIYKKIIYEDEQFGSNEIGRGKKVVVEFSSPNIAKIFHAGHLRTTILGNFVRNLFKVSGYEVISINYLGDWGKQFGLLGVGFKKYGDEKLLTENPLKHLYEVYVKVNKEKSEIDQDAKDYFKKLEEGNNEQYQLWKRFRDLSIQKYKELYNRMHITFDVYSGESFYGEKGKEVVMNCPYISVDKDNSRFYDLGSLGKFCVIKNDGASLYSTRDIAAAIERIELYNPEKVYYVVASQQDLYFKQLFAVLDKMGYKDKFEHINYGMVNDMSTRKGNVVFLEDIIEESKNVMRAAMQKNEEKFNQINNVEETVEELALSAIIVQDFKAKRIKNYAFDMKRNTATEGETGPHLQYTHCRLVSIRNKNPDIVPEIYLECYDEENLQLFLFLLRYPMVIEECLKNFEPSTMVTYLMKLSKMINRMFSKYMVMNQKMKVASARLAMYESARIVLKNGMEILGMKPLERM